MRIACVHIPQFALQTLTRIDPSLRGAAVAVVGSGSIATSAGGALGTSDRERARQVLHGPVVHACSRAAWALGVRLGMTGTSANNLAGVRVVTAEGTAERETIRALADALLGIAPVVDVGGRIGAGGAHLAMYCEVPARTRGAAFGDKLLEVCTALGISARIGIADDRFTAWVAASSQTGGPSGDEGEVTSVPRGGSAAFLSPRPLSLLAITPEVQHMLESLGVRTLGEFAALPAPSVARPVEADFQALARGDSGSMLRRYTPESPIREDITLAPSQLPASGEPNGMSTSAAVGILAERVALRLAGRGRGAARIEITIQGAGGEKLVPIVPGLTSRGDRALPLSSLGEGAESSAFHAGRRVLESAEDLTDTIALALSIGSPTESGDQATVPYHLRATVTVEALVGEALAASTALAANANIAATGVVAANDERADDEITAARRAPVDLLGVVLSSTGTAGEAASKLGGHSWALREERRDSHRGMQRGKTHRRRTQTVEAQTRMFSTALDGK